MDVGQRGGSGVEGSRAKAGLIRAWVQRQGRGGESAADAQNTTVKEHSDFI